MLQHFNCHNCGADCIAMPHDPPFVKAGYCEETCATAHLMKQYADAFDRGDISGVASALERMADTSLGVFDELLSAFHRSRHDQVVGEEIDDELTVASLRQIDATGGYSVEPLTRGRGEDELTTADLARGSLLADEEGEE